MFSFTHNGRVGILSSDSDIQLDNPHTGYSGVPLCGLFSLVFLASAVGKNERRNVVVVCNLQP